MANVPESSSYDAGIYQLEVVDEVLGGVNGKANSQAKGLANRTKWLKDQVDALNLLKGKGVPAFSAANSYVGGDMVIYQKNIWVANTSVVPAAWNATQWTKQLGNAAESALADAVPLMNGTAAVGVSTDLAREDHVHPADTGREPAIAAGTVSQFWSGTKTWRDLATDVRGALLTGLSTATSTVVAATDSILVAIGKLQAQIALRATLDSPTLTGTPAAPTPAQFDNDTSLATTEFVQRALGNKRSWTSLSANTTLTVAHVGMTIGYLSGSTVTATLPSAAGLAIGSTISFYNNSAADQIVAAAGAETIAFGSVSFGGSVSGSFTIPSGCTAEFLCFGASGWHITDGTATLRGTAQPTPPKLDYDNSLATTAFVLEEGDRFKPMAGILLSTNTTVLDADRGGVHYVITAGITVTLPGTGASGYIGSCFTFQARENFTLSRSGANQIVSPTGAQATTLAVKKGETITLMDNFNNWVVVRNGFGSDSYATSLIAKGYQRLPSGLIIQWCEISLAMPAANTNYQYTATLPITFPTACRQAFANFGNNNPPGGFMNLTAEGLGVSAVQGFASSSSAGTRTIRVFAIGN